MGGRDPGMRINEPLSQVEIREERDLVLARQRARAVAARLGFDPQDQARIASAVSEVVRNVLQHASAGRIEFGLEGEPARGLVIRVVDRGPGIAEPDATREPPEAKAGGLGGLAGARRLMDGFRIDTGPGAGTVVTMTKTLPRRSPPVTARLAAEMAEELAGLDAPSPVEELLRQNRDLIRVLDELKARELELARLNRELEDTNRGVVALYLELDERAESLRQASEMKTRFLSHVSHELRTPLTSILSIGRLLMDRVDGELTVEQERQVAYILGAAQDLTGMVNDLLDLARIEAGRDVLRLEPVHLPDFFAALRGTLRPLLAAGSPVELVFEDPSGLPDLDTDEGKLAQVLRNLVSNALKFTEAGEVRVSARPGPDGSMAFAVADTGIGIAPAHLGRIFEEFGQVDGPLQRKVKGTGLGLPLARKLAELLGGDLAVRSRPGLGSTFTATIPIVHPDRAGPARGQAPPGPTSTEPHAQEGPPDA